MAARDEIIAWCDALLEAPGFADWCHNGIQVPGRAEVGRIVSGVSANLELLEAAAEREADIVLVHHGLFWGDGIRALTPALAGRLEALLSSGASLLAYHLPLDAHREVGNNALLCEALGLAAVDEVEFGIARGRAIGVVGAPEEGIGPGELAERVARACGSQPLHFDCGPARIERVGIVTGGGAGNLEEAIGLGLDALVTGEPSEPALATAREGAIHFLAAGHHASERFGVRRLGELIGERFGVEHEFVDVVNPV